MGTQTAEPSEAPIAAAASPLSIIVGNPTKTRHQAARAVLRSYSEAPSVELVRTALGEVANVGNVAPLFRSTILFRVSFPGIRRGETTVYEARDHRHHTPRPGHLFLAAYRIGQRVRVGLLLSYETGEGYCFLTDQGERFSGIEGDFNIVGAVVAVGQYAVGGAIIDEDGLRFTPDGVPIFDRRDAEAAQ